MSRPVRRIALQITPLIDTLLIVLFLQYLDSRQQAERTMGQAAAVERDAGMAVNQLADVRQQLERARATIAILEQASMEREQRAAQAEGDLELALAQQRLLGELMRDLYQIPAADLEAVLDPARDPPVARSPEEIERLRARFREMAEQTPGDAIRHLLTYEEILKRCDVWSLVIDGDGIATFSAGDQSFRIRVVPEQFEADFFERYQSLPQAKGLVIIVLTYDRASQRQFVQEVRRALPELVRRMREDSGNRTGFEYADLGLRIE
jgi:hypothetical protein